MALITFPSAENTSLANFLSNIRYTSVNIVTSNAVIPITGAVTGGDPDELQRLINGFGTVEFHWSGIVEVDGSQALAESSTVQHGTVKMHSGRWSIGRSWPLQDVTGVSAGGTADTQKRWWPQIGTIFGSVSGTVVADGPLYNTKTEALTIKNHLMTGTSGIVGTAFIQTMQTGNPLTQGGALPVSMSYIYQNDYAFDETGNGANFSAVLDEDVVLAPRATGMSIALDTGETLSNIAAYLRRFDISVPFNIGGRIVMRGVYRVDHP